MESIGLLEEAVDQIQKAVYATHSANWLDACRYIGRTAVLTSDAAPDIAQAAYDAGATKKEIAEALGISPRDLRGMTRSKSTEGRESV